MNWLITILLLVAAVAFAVLFMGQDIPVNRRHTLPRKIVSLPYRPSATMGSNAFSAPGLDTKALCATTDVC